MQSGVWLFCCVHVCVCMYEWLAACAFLEGAYTHVHMSLRTWDFAAGPSEAGEVRGTREEL